MTTLIHTPQEMIRQSQEWKRSGQQISLVPTMGALHAGHFSLIEQARRQADRVVVSIFVNPLQFGPDEDFSRYPRHEAKDTARVTAMGTDVLYLPKAEAIYPPGFATRVHIEGLGDRLCGTFRPGHFDGVLTVVLKLFLQVAPHLAIFGEKDYQQLQIIRRMVADWNIPVEIQAAPTLREGDGLAMSSRNEYLTPEERTIAPRLYVVLRETAKELAGGVAVSAALESAKVDLIAAGFTKLDYLELCDAETLEPLAELKTPARLLAAAWLGQTRLIDNVAVG